LKETRLTFHPVVHLTKVEELELERIATTHQHLQHSIKSPSPTLTKPHHPHTTATMVKLEEVEDEHFNTQQTGEDAWISDSDSGKKKPSLCAASYITLNHTD
jgi:hypothetical protein